MYDLNDNELQEYIKDDVPYFDLTTYLQNAKGKKAKLEIFTREKIVISCTEEASRIVQFLGCEVELCISSGEKVKKNETILSFHGDYEKVHQAWRLSQILLEYSCKMATYANNMKQQINQVNEHCELLATRKSFPFSKRFCIKSIMIGGAMPHRLGLSETILFFSGHRIIYENDTAFYESLAGIKAKVPEKKVVVESEKFEDAKELMIAGADVLQIDKVDIACLKKIISYRDQNYPSVKVLAAGGINLENVKVYATSGVDGIVTSAMYTSGMANLGSRMKLV